MKTHPQFRISIFAICFFAFSFNAMGNDTIRITWKGGGSGNWKTLDITATKDEQFTVDWGDGSAIETKIGKDYGIYLSHIYTDTNEYTVVLTGKTKDCLFLHLNCNSRNVSIIDVSTCASLQSLLCWYNQITNLDVSKNTALVGLQCFNCPLGSLDISKNTKLESLWCMNNQLTSLDVSKNLALRDLTCMYNEIKSLDVSKHTELSTLRCCNNQLTSLKLNNNANICFLECYDNQLQLSDLFTISEIIDSTCIYPRRLGIQRLVSQNLSIGSSVDFSAQKEFDGIATIFIVEKDGSFASADDYAIHDGIFTFYQRGIYTITMTNDAILSNPDSPAQVIAEFNVGNVDIADVTQEKSDILIYPNPTTGLLKIESNNLLTNDIQVFDILGKRQQVPYNKQQMSGIIEIDISHLSAGIYLIQKDGKTSKVIKN